MIAAKKYFREIYTKNQKQDPVIDAIRALSVLSIIAFHIVVGVIQVYDHNKAKQYILAMPDWLQPLWHGEKGVDAFFLLSALVVGLSLFKNIENFSTTLALDFLKKKFFRIYPLFLLALVLYTVGQWSYFAKYFFSNLFFLNNIISGERAIVPVGWFLTVEVQYFILTPLLFFALKKIKYRGWALTALFLSSVGACAVALLTHGDLYLRPITDLFLAEDRSSFSNQMGTFFYEAPNTRYGPFVAGFLLAYLRVFYSNRLAALLKNRAVGVGVFLLAILFILFPVTTPIYDPTSWFYRPFSSTQNFWMLALSRQVFAAGIMLLVLGCWYSGGVFKVLNSLFNLRIWQPLSKLSFSIYLFHFPFIAVAAAIIFGTTNLSEVSVIGPGHLIAIFFLATTLSILFAIPLHLYIERPFIERGKK